MTGIACCLIREQPHYRRDAFICGLLRAGKKLVGPGHAPSSRNDWLLIWNRYGEWEREANVWEARGGTVLVCENGYIGKDLDGLQYYAIAVHGHNGSGRWYVGDEDRFAYLGLDLKPWTQNESGHWLVCGQRGIGSKTMASPFDWHMRTAKPLLEGRHPLRIRAHPGRHEPQVPLAKDLEGAAACVIWSSSSGVAALVSGIPVLYGAPHWVCETGARPIETQQLLRDDDARRNALHRMAWAQWTIGEISHGLPFDYLSMVQ